MSSPSESRVEGALACLGGARASAEIRADFAALSSLPAAARRQLYRVLGPCLVEPVPASTEADMRAFAGEHDADVPAIVRVVRACRFLLREAAMRDVAMADFADDLQLLGADDDTCTALLQGYDRAKELVRANVVQAAISDHGKVVERVAWRVDHVTASHQAYALHVPVAVLTLSYREGDKRERVTLQLSADAVLELGALVARFT